MRIDLGLGPASLALLWRRAGIPGPTGFAQVVLGGQPIVHRGQAVIVRTGE